MANYRHIVRLPYASGLPEDVAVNVWHSICDNDSEAAAFADHLVTFYGAIDQLLSSLLSSATDAASITTYDLADAEPRVPTDTELFTLTLNASNMATEKAICLSFQGIKISGLPQSRRRGRVYLGPLGGIHDSTTGRPNTTHITTMATAADTLLTTTSADPLSGIWAVYSPTDGQTIPVQNGWIDNEYDTVRSRGRKPTSRVLFS